VSATTPELLEFGTQQLRDSSRCTETPARRHHQLPSCSMVRRCVIHVGSKPKDEPMQGGRTASYGGFLGPTHLEATRDLLGGDDTWQVLYFFSHVLQEFVLDFVSLFHLLYIPIPKVSLLHRNSHDSLKSVSFFNIDMEHFQRNNANAFGPSRESSVYSTDSSTAKQTASSDYAESRTSTSSRPVSIVPSYMNAVPTRKPVKSRPMSIGAALNYENGTRDAVETSARRPATLTKGTLILAIATVPHPSTISYLEMMLRRGAYSGIAVVGHVDYEAELKQLKMNIYALLGKLSLEVGVQVELQKSWSEEDISDSISKSVTGEDILHGVLCSPAFEAKSIAAAGVLQLDEAVFEEQWRASVSFLRNLAKATVPRIKPNTTSRAASGQFLITELPEISPVSSIYKAACDRIIIMLADSNLRLTIAYADTVLIPEPVVETNGKLDISTHAGSHDVYAHDFNPGESPTKLWNMWSQMEELST